MLEIDEGLFDGISPDEYRHTLSALRGVLDRALVLRAESARFILAVGNTAREPAHPDGAVVTNALGRIVEFLCHDERGPRLPRADALNVAAALAQASGVIPGDLPNPVAALRDRIDNGNARTTDLKALFNSRAALAETRLRPGMTFEEIARRTQAIALGLWPDDPARGR